MRLLLHLDEVRDVLVVTAVGVDQSLVILHLACLHILVHIDVSFIRGDQKVAVVNEDKHVENLFAEVHDVSK